LGGREIPQGGGEILPENSASFWETFMSSKFHEKPHHHPYDIFGR